jgi:hypothetical protein
MKKLLILFTIINTGCYTNLRGGVISTFDKRGDLGVEGSFHFGAGKNFDQNCYLITTSVTGGISAKEMKKSGSFLMGFEYMKLKLPWSYRFNLSAGYRVLENTYAPYIQGNVGVFEPIKNGKMKYGSLSVDLFLSYFFADEYTRGVWFGIGLVYQFDKIWGSSEED